MCISCRKHENLCIQACWEQPGQHRALFRTSTLLVAPSATTQSSPGSHEALQSVCRHADAAVVAWKQAREGHMQQAPCVQACLRHKPAFATLPRVCAACCALN